MLDNVFVAAMWMVHCWIRVSISSDPRLALSIGRIFSDRYSSTVRLNLMQIRWNLYFRCYLLYTCSSDFLSVHNLWTSLLAINILLISTVIFTYIISYNTLFWVVLSIEPFPIHLRFLALRNSTPPLLLHLSF